MLLALRRRAVAEGHRRCRFAACRRCSIRSRASTASRISSRVALAAAPDAHVATLSRPTACPPSKSSTSRAASVTVQALAGVDLAVERGEFFGLLGPERRRQDHADLDPRRAHARRPRHGARPRPRRRRRFSRRAPQPGRRAAGARVRSVLHACARRSSSRRAISACASSADWIDEILHHLDLTSKANANMRSLSGGMKRRVLVGQALVHKPPVIVLDEPTAGVDVELRQSLWEFIRKLNRDGHTIILTTHYLEEAEALCGRIAMLKAGRVVALDSTAESPVALRRASRAGWSPRALPAAWRHACRARRARRVLTSRSNRTPSSSSCSPRCARRASRSTSWRSRRPTSSRCSCDDHDGQRKARDTKRPCTTPCRSEP